MNQPLPPSVEGSSSSCPLLHATVAFAEKGKLEMGRELEKGQEKGKPEKGREPEKGRNTEM